MCDSKTVFPDRDWSSYYKHKSNLVPRDTLLKVLELFDDKKNEYVANDVGCGHGADTLELLKRGWKVNAFDSEQEGLLLLEQSLPEGLNKNLTLLNQRFENIELPVCDLLNASYSIPFCSPDHFNDLWNKIENSIKTKGRFAGTLFGVNDEWSANERMTFHSKEEVDRLFTSFHIEYLDEKDEHGATSDGTPKHWHVFSVIAVKNK